MRKIHMARTDAGKLTRRKLGRTLLRPLGLAELEHVAGGDPPTGLGEVETDGVWTVKGDGSPY